MKFWTDDRKKEAQKIVDESGIDAAVEAYPHLDARKIRRALAVDWTREEDDLLIQAYMRGKIPEAMTSLPHRTKLAIEQRATKLRYAGTLLVPPIARPTFEPTPRPSAPAPRRSAVRRPMLRPTRPQHPGIALLDRGERDAVTTKVLWSVANLSAKLQISQKTIRSYVRSLALSLPPPPSCTTLTKNERQAILVAYQTLLVAVARQIGHTPEEVQLGIAVCARRDFERDRYYRTSFDPADAYGHVTEIQGGGARTSFAPRPSAR